jgi:hypothetical protein
MKIYSNRGQGVFLVLYSLRKLGGICTKQEVISFIQHADLYEISRHDLPPYKDQSEPRYHTLIAWARKDAMLEEWLVDTKERDAWQLSRDGADMLDRTTRRYQTSELTVRNCYLWTAKFKRQIDQTYKPSPEDAKRPEDSLIEYI